MPVLLVLALNVLVAVVWACLAHTPGLPLRMWVVLVSMALLISSFKARTNAIRVQDRLIRLEECLRYREVLSPEQAGRAAALPLHTLIALRFASDAELPELLDRAISQKLSPKQIKDAVVNWRADTHRV